jgi:hypothetical protein
MVLPLIPLALIAAGGGSGGIGIFSMASGAAKLKEARQILDDAKAAYDRTVSSTEKAVAVTKQRITDYGREQEEAQQRVVTRMADFIRRHQGRVSESPWLFADGVEAEVKQVPGFPGTSVATSEWLSGAGRAGFFGAATFVGVPAAVGALGTASTGTAIGSLSGAAAHSATLAWLGGGSLASGGGGIALGAASLNFVTVGPALLVGGLVLNGRGGKALTQASTSRADVDFAVANHKKFRTGLALLRRRITELSRLLSELSTRADRALDDLERDPFDPAAHAEKYQTAWRLTLAVRDVAQTPVLDDDHKLNSATAKLFVTYREMK